MLQLSGEGLSRYHDVAQTTCSKFCFPKQSHDAIPHNIDPVPSQTQNSQSWASGTTYERKGSRDCSKGQIKTHLKYVMFVGLNAVPPNDPKKL